MYPASLAYRQILQCSRTTDIQYVAWRGWLTRPTNRSVVARQRYKSLEDECREFEDTLWRATRIREFPIVAVMERRMWTAENEMDCCLNSLAQTWEHSDPSNFFCLCFTSSYTCCRHHPAVVSTLSQVILSYNEEYFVLTAPFKSRWVKP